MTPGRKALSAALKPGRNIAFFPVPDFFRHLPGGLYFFERFVRDTRAEELPHLFFPSFPEGNDRRTSRRFPAASLIKGTEIGKNR